MSQSQLLLSKFYENEKKLANKIYLRQPFEGRWITFTWAEAGREARKMAQRLRDLNLPAGSSIALTSKNCAHWLISDLAIMMAGHVSVPLYPTLKAENITYILNHCNARVFIAGKLDEWDKQSSGVPQGIPMVSFPYWPNQGTQTWQEFIGNTQPMQQNFEPEADALATIIYTSGTTGEPKGVMHSFRTLCYHIPEILNQIKFTDSERFFSYLPLSHIAERAVIELGSLYADGEVYFAESLDSFAENLREAQPTIFLAVPRIWVKFQQGILAKVPQKKLSRLLAIPFVNKLIRKKILNAIGLGSTRFALTGAAAISKDLLEWYAKLGLNIHEVYGMTESSAIISFNLPNRTRFGTVGAIWPNTEVRISQEGEILSRSGGNMVGYYKKPEETAATLKDGWLQTGDKGILDADGYLRITGRVKDLFKTAKGKYISPAVIEEHFSSCTLIEQVCVLGSGMPQPMALVVLNEYARKIEKPQVEREMSELFNYVNDKIENWERLKNIVVLHDDWSIDNGILTPTLKIKRNVVEEKYAGNMEAWFQRKEEVVFRS